MVEQVLSGLKWDADGLVPGIVQDARSSQVRMLGYLNAEALRATIDTGFVHFYSRSRQKLWKKGETSGNVLEFVDATPDCDADTLLIRAIPHGPTCHTGEETCFFSAPLATNADAGLAEPADHIVAELADVVAERRREMPEGSYTTYLFDEGVDKIGKKIGEEAAEVIIAAKNGDSEPLAAEAADLIYHL
ncbi:MAG: bifunctional phosphoribosyl-AMP cyclohydrolase/phosphoribosyl-ATP diphosphatase HisIE, partial [Chloroflexota bacterium]